MLLVADNLQITNSVIARALESLDPKPIQELVARCEAAGAEAVDINSGPLSREPEKKMIFLVEAVQDVTSLPILLDTVNPLALEAGLRAAKKTAIINGFSLEPVKRGKILPLAKQYDCAIIGYLLYPDSHVPADASQRMTVAVELFDVFRKTGLAPERLIIDPVIVPLTWQNGPAQVRDVITVVRQLPDLLGFPVRTIAGLSNLTMGSGYRQQKIYMEMACLTMLAEAGLSMALINVLHRDTVRIAGACRALSPAKIFSWEELS